MRITPSALASEREHEIPACITLAQAILESATAAGWGSSPLFRLANNPFGIRYCHFPSGDGESGSLGDAMSKGPSPALQAAACASSLISRSGSSPDHPIAGSPDHPTPDDYGAFEATTWEIENGQKKVVSAEFQRFPNLEEAFRAHALLLCMPRYGPAYAVRHDWKKFAERLGPKSSPLDLEHCGYATNPSYPAELTKLVNLYRLDDPRAQQWYATGKDPGIIGSADQPVIG